VGGGAEITETLNERGAVMSSYPASLTMWTATAVVTKHAALSKLELTAYALCTP